LTRELPLQTYPIFQRTDGRRVAINPATVTRILEIGSGSVKITFVDGQSLELNVGLENVIARLSGAREPASH
jgi:hypothetical protein